MASKLIFIVLLLFVSRIESASLLERSYEYVMSLGKSLAPSFMTVLDCFGEDDVWSCAKEKAGKMLESWEAENEKQRRTWEEAADQEVSSSGRAIEELPSKLGREVEGSLLNIADLVQNGMARALSRHHEDSGNTITISTGGGDKKKKMKKKKKKPAKIHLVHPMMMQMEDDRNARRIQSWVIGKTLNDSAKHVEWGLDSQKAVQSVRKAGGLDIEQGDRDRNLRSLANKGRGVISDMWEMGEKAIDAVAEHAIKNDETENGVEDKSSLEEQRGKKKKKKKAILKLLILGAVLKAKIGTLLQILSFKLQVKFFLIALIGLGINLARFWIDLKKQHTPPQKVIYYEHAQHQHHYDHEEESPGWGPWSRSMDPEETDVEIDVDLHNTPYRAQVDREAQTYSRPLITRV